MASLRRAGTDVLVCMLTLSELRELDLAEEAAAAEAAGVRFIWVPTPDRGTPELQRSGPSWPSSSPNWRVAITSSSIAGWA